MKTNALFSPWAILVILLFFASSGDLFAAGCAATGSGSWDDPLIWSCGRVPLSSDDVSIEDFVVDIENADAVCGSLTLKVKDTDAALYLKNGYDLTTSGNAKLEQKGNAYKITLSVEGISSKLKVTGSMEVKQDAGEEVLINLSNTNSEIEVTGNCTFTRDAPADKQLKVTMSGTDCLYDVGGTLKLDHKDGGSTNMWFDLSGGGATLKSVGELEIKHTGGAGKIFISISNSGDIDADSDINFEGVSSAGAAEIEMSDNSAKLYIFGNLVRRDGGSRYGILDGQGQSTVVYNGTAAQTFGDTEPGSGGDKFNYKRVEISKSTGDITLENHVAIEDALKLSGGKIILGTYNLTINSTAAITGDDNTKYIVTDNTGYLRQNTIGDEVGGRAGNIDFPVGISTASYTPVTLNNNNSDDNDDFSVRVCNDIRENGLCAGGVAEDDSLVNKTWTIDMVTVNSTSISSDVTLEWNIADQLPGFENDKCRIIRHNGSGWVTEQDSGGTGTIRTITGIAAFSPFGVERQKGGSKNGPLPINLLSFTAKLVDKTKVELIWITSSESNNNYFTIERSKNGLTFKEIAEVPGAGNSNSRLEYESYDDSPLEGISYYRLKQTDYDGQYEYFNIVVVSYTLNADGSCVLKVFPNPCIGRCTVNLSECEHNENAEIRVEMIDALGNLVYSNVPYREFDGSFQFSVDPSNNLKPGVYIIRGTSATESYSNKIIVK